MAEAQTILVSAISFFEVAQKVRLGKWPEMAPYVERLPALLASQRGVAASLEAADCLMAGTMIWTHRDPFDRFLGASPPHSDRRGRRGLRWRGCADLVKRCRGAYGENQSQGRALPGARPRPR
jgi:hypothetical protein